MVLQRVRHDQVTFTFTSYIYIFFFPHIYIIKKRLYRHSSKLQWLDAEMLSVVLREGAWQHVLSKSLGLYFGLELLDHSVTLCLTS